MIQITIDNRRLLGSGLAPKVAEAISDRLSYLQAGYQHSPAYQNHNWDGRRRLASISGNGNIQAPLGVAEAVISFLRENNIEFNLTNNRKLPEYTLEFESAFDFGKLREYQRGALAAATSPRGILGLRGRGIIKMPPRAGKTLTAAAIIASFNVRTLFIVPSKLLLYQAKEVLERAFGFEVGIIGDQQWLVGDITVATVQSLLSKRGHRGRGTPPTKEYVDLLRSVDLLIVDECHHLSGDSEWRRVIQDSNAPYKIGLSATVFLDHDRECELGVIWLRACTGDIIVDVSTSDLIDQGFLVQPEIHMYPIREPDYRKSKWSKTLQKQAIYNNTHRNRLIVDLALKHARDGKQLVVITNRVEQIGIIFRMLLASGDRNLSAARITGATPAHDRTIMLDAFRRGDVQILVSTVLDEGVDVPEIDMIINAEGGRDIKSTFQRMRCLTPAPGKAKAYVVDFMDLTNKYFAAHSLDRLAAYRSERAFRIKVYKDYPLIPSALGDKSGAEINNLSLQD